MSHPFIDARRPVVLLIGVASYMLGLPALLSGSTITYFTTRSSFNAAAPGLPTEGFNNARIPAGTYGLQSSPLSSATNNSIFSAGSIKPGLTISNGTAGLKPGLIVYGAGAIYGGTNAVGTNWFGDPLVLSFGSGVTALGADVFAATSPGLTRGGQFTADFFNGTTLLGSTTFTENLGEFGFLGAASSTPITSVDLLYTTDDATTFADNISFGSSHGPPPPPPAVPEPSTFTLMALGTVILGVAVRKAV